MISADDRRLMQSRARGMRPTNDLAKKYSCVVDNRHNWKMFEWLSWADIWITFIM